MTSNRKRSGIITALMAGSILCALVIGCGGGGSCTAELTVEGNVYRGTDRDPVQAKTNACNGYCIEGDPDYDAAFRKWLESPESQNVPERKNKWTGYHKNNDLRVMVERCITRCKEFAEDGVYKMEVNCR